MWQNFVSESLWIVVENCTDSSELCESIVRHQINLSEDKAPAAEWSLNASAGVSTCDKHPACFHKAVLVITVSIVTTAVIVFASPIERNSQYGGGQI